MDFSAVPLTEDQQAFAEEVKAGLRERSSTYDESLYLALGAKGWLFPRWRKEDGGAGLDDVCVRILETELAKRDAPILVLGTTHLVCAAVGAHADPALHDELKPHMANGTVRFAL